MHDWYRGGIAVVGSAVHVAGNTRSSEDLFNLLVECRDVAQRVPCTRFNAQTFGTQDSTENRRGKTDAPFGYFCDDISQFDTSPGLFGVSPSECKHVDPQQRQLLLLTADAIRNAGMSVGDVFNTNTGVFIGNMNRDYMMLAADGSIINQYSSQGSASAIAANRISFTFNFRGVLRTTTLVFLSCKCYLKLGKHLRLMKQLMATLEVKGVALYSSRGSRMLFVTETEFWE
jgi:acyl transferase domain-containing protein